MVNTQYATQIQFDINATSVVLISHDTPCELQFKSVQGCFDCESPPTSTFSCLTAFGSTTVTFQCNSTEISPIPCEKTAKSYNATITAKSLDLNEECIASCPANIIPFQLIGTLTSKTIAPPPNESSHSEEEIRNDGSFLTSIWQNIKKAVTAIGSFLSHWYGIVLVVCVLALIMFGCFFFGPNIFLCLRECLQRRTTVPSPPPLRSFRQNLSPILHRKSRRAGRWAETIF